MTNYRGIEITDQQRDAIQALHRQGHNLRDVPVSSASGGIVYTLSDGKLAGIGADGDTFGFPAAQAETSAAPISNATPAAAPSAPARQPWQLEESEQRDFSKAEIAHRAALEVGRKTYEVVSDPSPQAPEAA